MVNAAAPRFADRSDAGRRLASLLLSYRAERPLVLALPRGGVPVGFEIARALHAQFDVFLVRKLGVPGHRELAMGAIAAGGVCVLDRSLIHALGVSEQQIERVRAEESAELERRETAFRDGRPPIEPHDETVILVDDGLATGSTARAALSALRSTHPRRLVLAVPVCAHESLAALRHEADTVISVLTPKNFIAVGFWYDRFDQTSDAEVVDLLRRARAEWSAGE